MKRLSFVLFVTIVLAACNNNGGGVSWSTADQQKFMNTCLQNAMNAGGDEQTSKAHCNCTLGKIANKYKSYAEADAKMTADELSTLEQECLQQLQNGGNGNKKGGIFGGGTGG